MPSLNTAESRVEEYHNKIREKYLANIEGLKIALVDALAEYYANQHEFMVPSTPKEGGLNQVASFIHVRPKLKKICDEIGTSNINAKELFSMYMEAMPLAKIKYEEEAEKK